jgi:prepilin-type N-terminal cleavage/methylation domain-containing protein
MPTSRTKGFSLIEVTVAIAIIAVLIVATGLMLQRIPVSGREVRDQDLALKIARSEIEVLRAEGYDALPVTGSFTHPLLTSLASSTASLTVTNYNTKTKQVTATVTWRGAGLVMRSLSLTTLITENSSLP